VGRLALRQGLARRHRWDQGLLVAGPPLGVGGGFGGGGRRGLHRLDLLRGGGGRLLGGYRFGLGLALDLEGEQFVSLAHLLPHLHHQSPDDARMGRGNLHGRLVALQCQEGVLYGDLVTLFDQDLDDLHRFEVTDVWQQYICRFCHVFSSSCR